MATAVDPKLPILLVDQYRTMLRVIRKQLEQIGLCNVDEARDGVDALHKLQRHPYGLVISDWDMAPMSGLELLAEIRADGRLRELPFLVLATGTACQPESVALSAGASGCLVKPFDSASLGRAIAELVQDPLGPPAARRRPGADPLGSRIGEVSRWQ